LLDLSLKNKRPVRVLMCGVDLLSVELGEEYQSERVIDLRGSIRKDVAHADRKPAVIQPGSVIQTCKGEKFYFDIGDWSPGPQFAVCRAENGLEVFQRQGFRFFSVFGSILMVSLAP